MKQSLIFCLFALFSLSTYAQKEKEFIVRGQLNNVEDGTIVMLMQQMGNMGISVVNDTLRNSRFSLKWHVEDVEKIENFSVSVRGEDFPSMSLPLWIKAGSDVKITGNDKWIYTWGVESKVPEQAEKARFVNASRNDWIEYQRLSAQRSVLYKNIENISQEEYKRIRVIADSLDRLADPYMRNINLKELDLLEQGSVSDIGMGVLNGLALTVKYSEDKSLSPRIEAVYNKLTDEQKNSRKGRSIHVNLFPPQVVKTGEPMIDTKVFDLEGKEYNLSDFKGKYLLLDFWSTGCGPCIMAMPEMGELAEEYKNRLTIISLSLDTKKGWQKGSEMHKMTWMNLSDGEEMQGVAAKYGVTGMPNYTIISPEGIVLGSWMGYGKGSLKKKIKEYIKD